MHIVSGYPLYCDEADRRKNYYEPPHIYGWLYYDGDRHGTINYATWRNKIASRMAIPSPVTMTMRGNYDAPGRTGTIRVTYRNDGAVPMTGRAVLVVTEDSIYYPAPNNDSVHNHVARDYLPTENGLVVTIPASDSVTVSQPFGIAPGWDDRQCQIVAWIQNDSAYADSTREIWQGAATRISQLVSIAQEPREHASGKSLITPTVLSTRLVLPKGVRYRIWNVTGGTTDLAGMKPGVYFVEIARRGRFKVIKVR